MKIMKFIKNIIKKIFGRPIDNREMTLVEWLRSCGANIGENVEMIECKCNPKDATCLEIGSNVTLSYTHILTHDASLKIFVGNDCNKIGRVVIGNNVFCGIHTIILPNVHIGNNVVIGAGSVVTKNIPDNSVAVGNPAKVICSCSDYINKHKERLIDADNTYWDVERLKMSSDELKAFNINIDNKIVYMLESEKS